jgi:hypothetical protein
LSHPARREKLRADPIREGFDPPRGRVDPRVERDDPIRDASNPRVRASDPMREIFDPIRGAPDPISASFDPRVGGGDLQVGAPDPRVGRVTNDYETLASRIVRARSSAIRHAASRRSARDRAGAAGG